MKQLKTAIKAIAKANPLGFTVELQTLNEVTSGIVASYEETQNCFDDIGLEKVIKHSLKHDKVIGGWFNDENGKYYFDSCRIFTDLDKAKEFGKENNQIAIFDIGNLRLIKL